MNPVDTNANIRTQRPDIDQATRRSSEATRSADSATSAPDASAETGSESVTFTRAAADLLSLENQLRDLPGIDQARVDSIRQAIDDGSYQVDAQRIVDSLLQNDRELG
ncbi:MAG: flagellar biosynthesis anti-sigma factor FlgM [Pseudomonadota bacterium]